MISAAVSFVTNLSILCMLGTSFFVQLILGNKRLNIKLFSFLRIEAQVCNSDYDDSQYKNFAILYADCYGRPGGTSNFMTSCF